VFLYLFDPLRDDDDKIIHKVVTGTPHLDAGGKTAEVPNLELCAMAARDAAARRDVGDSANPNLGGKVTVIIDDRVVADKEVLRMTDPAAGRNDGFHVF